MNSDDLRLAKASKRLRRELGLQQADLSTSRYVVQEIEAGRAGGLRLDLVRAHFTVLGAKAHLNIWWNGAALDRLLDRDHSEVVDVISRLLPGYGFSVKTEHTFSDYGERGSIDIFGGRDDVRAVFVGEAKSEWGVARGDAAAAGRKGAPGAEARPRRFRLDAAVRREHIDLPERSILRSHRWSLRRDSDGVSGSCSRNPILVAAASRPHWRDLVPD